MSLPYLASKSLHYWLRLMSSPLLHSLDSATSTGEPVPVPTTREPPDGTVMTLQRLQVSTASISGP